MGVVRVVCVVRVVGCSLHFSVPQDTGYFQCTKVQHLNCGPEPCTMPLTGRTV